MAGTHNNTGPGQNDAQTETERKIEAVLFAAEEPLDIDSIKVMIKKQEINIDRALQSLQKQYENRGVNLICISVSSFKNFAESNIILFLLVLKVIKWKIWKIIFL